jgi:glutamate N-acetyltransferase/amino-acid N-acetyltransferase
VWYIFRVQMSTKIEIITNGGVTTPKGFSAGATYAGIKKKSKDALDLSLLYSEVPCAAAAVFTTNKIKAAPVILDKQKLDKTHRAQAVIINSGCANACTGEQGMIAAVTTADVTAKSLGISSDLIMVASTGVIGVQLPVDKIEAGLSHIVLSSEGGNILSKAIMTTDTQPKQIAVKVESSGITFNIGGVCKGAGMIHPDMATMLCFLTTDAAVDSDYLKTALNEAVGVSFNLISVDGDTSTNDTVLLMANGLAGNKNVNSGSPLADGFQQALNQVCLYLAKRIARDGEGATRLIEVTVNGAKSLKDARLAVRTITSSPLVKTAVHGCDPNWGRIIAAAGRSGAELVPEKADVYIGDMCLMKKGLPLEFDKKLAAAWLNKAEVVLRVELNIGQASATGWGCDLSEEYVVINSEYTT